MPQFVSVLGAATQAIGAGLRRTVSESSALSNVDPFTARTGYHTLLRSLYENDVYEDAKMWQAYKARYRLPRSIRGIYNPTRRAVDAWPGRVYPGPWTKDGRPLSDGTPNAIPFTTDALTRNPALITAAIQTLDWGNWSSERTRYVREGNKLGSVFVVVVDDMERRKVYPEIVPLERLADLTLDATGNVKAYALQYQIRGRGNRPVTFRREVTRTSITEKEDKETTLEVANPYGFVPAIWVRNRHVGGLFGAPAIAGVIAKIDELNALVTAIHNYVHRWHNQPMVFYGGNAPTPVTAKGAATDDDGVTTEMEMVRWMHSNDASGHVDPLMREMAIGQAGAFVTNLIEEIESDLPELVIDEQLRSMSQLTGPAANQIMGDVRGKLEEEEGNYDAGTVKMMQMGVAIGGWRLSTGAWGLRSQVTRQQAAFDGFDLTSFARSELDVELAVRPLVAQTPTERLMQWQLEKDVLGLSDAEMRRRAGIDEVSSARIEAELSTQRETAFAAGAFA